MCGILTTTAIKLVKENDEGDISNANDTDKNKICFSPPKYFPMYPFGI